MTNAPTSGAGRAIKQVRFGDAVIEYRVQRSRRRKKTIQISVTNEGVVVAAPARTPEREVREVVLRRASWIIQRLAERTPEPEPLQFVSGERLPYRGLNLELAVQFTMDTRPAAPEIYLTQEKLSVILPGNLANTESPNLENPQAVRDALLGWYQERAGEGVREQVNHWWPALGRGDSPRILIRNQRRRWGSCAHDGTLRFNWRLAMLEPALTEYVVVHELAHLTHMNHSTQFWDLVARHLPDAPARRQKLKEAGRGLPL